MVLHTIADLDGKLLWVAVEGDLELIGADDLSAAPQAERDEDLQVSVSPDRVTITCETDLRLRAPAGGRVHIEKVQGDAAVRFWTGPLEIGSIGGDLVLEQTAAVKVQSVGGDCRAAEVSGPVEISNVGGDFVGRALQSDVIVENVGSDFRLAGAGGNVSATAGSDIRVSVTQTIGQSIVLVTGSDARVDLPSDPSVSIRAASGGLSIKVILGGSREHHRAGRFEATYGSGDTRLEITAGSDITISDGNGAGETSGSAKRTQWEDRVVRKTEKALRKAEEQLAHAERQAKRSSHLGQEAVRRAEERVQAAMRRLEARRQGRSEYAPGVFEPEQPFNAEPGGATEEERMLILQMVQEKKITVEEADRLLAVLEGNPE